MARVLLITPYNESDLGCRQLIANLRAEGHEAYLLCAKLTRTKDIPSNEGWDPLWQVSVLPGGGLKILSYPDPLSPAEVEHLQRLIRKIRPHFIGISVYTAFVQQAAQLAQIAKQTAPDAVVSWGGPHVTLDPVGSAEFCDVGFVGECDLILGDFLKALEIGKDWRQTPNIVWRENGKLHRNPVGPVVKDLDSIPYPYWGPEGVYYLDEDELLEGRPHDFSELHTYYKILTSRGCPYVCTYCVYSLTKNVMPDIAKLRFRSIPHCMQELEEAKARQGHFYLEIEDDIFTVRPERMREFFNEYSQRIRMPFGCQTHPNYARPEMLQILKEHHAEFVAMGIQSGSERIANELYDRRTTRERVLEAAHNIHASGLRAFYDIITNNPFETEEDCRATFELLRELPKPYEMRMGILIIYPGMPIWHMCKEAGISPVADYQRFRFWNALYYIASTVDLSDKDVEFLLNNEELRRDPSLLEAIAGTTVRLTHEGLDSRILADNYLREVYRLADRIRQLEGELHYIKARRGFRQFMWISERARKAKRRLVGLFKGRQVSAEKVAPACAADDGCATPRQAVASSH